jgi:hypothetical protein
MQDQFDFGYRPGTYWPWLPNEATMLAQIKGSARRAAAAAALEVSTRRVTRWRSYGSNWPQRCAT